MGDTQDMIYLEAKFHSSYKPAKPGKLCVAKMQLWNKHQIDIPILKGDIRRKKGVAGPWQIQN